MFFYKDILYISLVLFLLHRLLYIKLVEGLGHTPNSQNYLSIPYLLLVYYIFNTHEFKYFLFSIRLMFD